MARLSAPRYTRPMSDRSAPNTAAREARRRAHAAALAWQLDCGVDETLSEQPFDWTSAPDAQPAVRAPAAPKRTGSRGRPGGAPTGQTAPPPKADPQAAALAKARALAEGAADLGALRAALESFDGSSLKKGARSTVFADGDPRAPVMVIGEAPGRDEDRVGKPFVGRSGGLLDRMLAAIGLARGAEDPAQGAYITNVVFYRPLENRTPDDAEVRLLLPFTERHIELARPKALLCLGNVPAKHLMEAGAGITRFRGTWTTYRVGAVEVPALASFHPAFLLRSPEQKRHAWRDLLSLRAKLDARD